MSPIHILLVEDNEGDIFLTTEALEEAKINNTISIAKNGEEAVHYIEKTGKFKNVKTPDLVILDVNLPKLNGIEVLQYIKESEKYMHIPVIMLTTSSSNSDILHSYKNHANCYITKPVEADEFLNAVVKIENFWINLVKLPNRYN